MIYTLAYPKVRGDYISTLAMGRMLFGHQDGTDYTKFFLLDSKRDTLWGRNAELDDVFMSFMRLNEMKIWMPPLPAAEREGEKFLKVTWLDKIGFF